MTSKAITIFNQWQLRPLVRTTSSLPLFSFFSDLVKKPVDVSGDPREHKWLYQRQSLAVVRGNTASIYCIGLCASLI